MPSPPPAETLEGPQQEERKHWAARLVAATAAMKTSAEPSLLLTMPQGIVARLL